MCLNKAKRTHVSVESAYLLFGILMYIKTKKKSVMGACLLYYVGLSEKDCCGRHHTCKLHMFIRMVRKHAVHITVTSGYAFTVLKSQLNIPAHC